MGRLRWSMWWRVWSISSLTMWYFNSPCSTLWTIRGSKTSGTHTHTHTHTCFIQFFPFLLCPDLHHFIIYFSWFLLHWILIHSYRAVCTPLLFIALLFTPLLFIPLLFTPLLFTPLLFTPLLFQLCSNQDLFMRSWLILFRSTQSTLLSSTEHCCVDGFAWHDMTWYGSIWWFNRVEVEISDPEIYQVESVISAPTARYGKWFNHSHTTQQHVTRIDLIALRDPT